MVKFHLNPEVKHFLTNCVQRILCSKVRLVSDQEPTMAVRCCDRFVGMLSRTKFVDMSKVTETRLSRCLGTLDLTALGIGATLGAGIYVVAGQVARQTAGPSVVLSFLIAAIASVFAGLCYAEFGARVPKTGSAYVYSYVTVGELWAFIIGWNLILEYVIGTASVARAFSTYFDSLIGGHIEGYFKEHLPMNVSSLSSYPDFFAFGITLILTGVLCLGVKESSILNNVFTLLNLVVVAYIVICGIFKIDFNNWSIPKDEVPTSTDPNYTNGKGGFFPYGVGGMLSGAATCFYAFVGFDIIATTGEEVRNPQKAIPVAIVVSLFTCFLAYFGVSSILTLMVPYYSIDTDAPIPKVFEAVGWDVAKYIIAIGAVAGLSTSLLGGMFPMPRIIYAMAQDGLIFRFLSWVPERFKTPVAATIVSGFMAAVMAMLFDLKELVDMMSIGTLLAYTLVAACVLILRYKRVPFPTYESTSQDQSDSGSINLAKVDTSSLDQSETSQLVPKGPGGLLSTLFNPESSEPTETSERIAKLSVSVLGLVLVGMAAFLVFCERPLVALEWWTFLILSLFLLIVAIIITIIWRQPENLNYVTFKVPAVPLISTLSMFVNVYLMMKLSKMTWLRFGVWLTLGFIIYFSYGIWQSTEEQRQKYERQMEQEAEAEPVSEVTTSSRTENTSLIYEGT